MFWFLSAYLLIFNNNILNVQDNIDIRHFRKKFIAHLFHSKSNGMNITYCQGFLHGNKIYFTDLIKKFKFILSFEINFCFIFITTKNLMTKKIWN